MPVLARPSSLLLWFALLLVGCPRNVEICPEATIVPADPEIPPGLSSTELTIEVRNPIPISGLRVMTEISTTGGVVEDPFARETTFSCAHDVFGPAEICVRTTYTREDAPAVDATDEAIAQRQRAAPAGEEARASHQYLRPPHVRLDDPLTCSETTCTEVICPETKNVCPVVSALRVETTGTPSSGTATIEVVAEDPDGVPEPLMTTLSATRGTIDDPTARQTQYTCDPDVGGLVQICVAASDGDPGCRVERCVTLECPGEPPDNQCPLIVDLAADPQTVPFGQTQTVVRVEVVDGDGDGDPVFTRFEAETGLFEDAGARETLFTCGAPGRVEICVEATDGDPACQDFARRCINVECPSSIGQNFCPSLFVINAIPTVIPPGETTTTIQTRGQDNDGKPQPLVLTLRALWGDLEDTENIQQSARVVAQNATYICNRPGQDEVCVDASDGACMKTLCRVIECPATIVPR